LTSNRDQVTRNGWLVPTRRALLSLEYQANAGRSWPLLRIHSLGTQ